VSSALSMGGGADKCMQNFYHELQGKMTWRCSSEDDTEVHLTEI
jgi:hypothetical protein